MWGRRTKHYAAATLQACAVERVEVTTLNASTTPRFDTNQNMTLIDCSKEAYYNMLSVTHSVELKLGR